MSFWDSVGRACASGDKGLDLSDSSDDNASPTHRQENHEEKGNLSSDSDSDSGLVHVSNQCQEDESDDLFNEPQTQPQPASKQKKKKRKGDEEKQISRDIKRYSNRNSEGRINYPDNSPLDDYDDGENPNTHQNKINRSRKKRKPGPRAGVGAGVAAPDDGLGSSDYLDEIEEAMEMGEAAVEEDEYESVPIIEMNWERAIQRECKYEEVMLRENKSNLAGLKPEPYDPEFNFLSYAVETNSQETSFPLFRNMFAFFSKTEETSDYVDLCMQVQDYYNQNIRPVSSVGNKCWPVKKIWEYFHITCPSLKHNLEFELRSLNVLFDTISNCILKRNKTTGKVDQMDIKCLKTKFQIMEFRNKLIRDVYSMRVNQNTEETKKQH